MKAFNLSNNIIFISFFVIMLFMYLTGLKLLYPPYYTVLPFFIIGLLGFFINARSIKKEYIVVLLIIFFSFFSYVFSSLINQVFIFDYIKQIPLLFLFNFFSAFFLVKFAHNFFSDKFVFFKLIIFSIIFQILISFSSYLFPSIYNFIFAIVDVGLDLNQVDSFNSSRIVGVGASFFGAGVLNSFFLVLVTILYQKKIIKNSFFYFLSFLVISVIGLMLSRTTSIGIFLSLMIIVSNSNKIKNFKILLFLILSLILVFFSLPILNKLNDRLFDIIKFGFEFIYNFGDSQAKDSASELPRMFEKLPTSYLTWLIGDAQYLNESGGYYKNIDVGYLRILYATGLFGLFLYIYLHFYLIKNNEMFHGYRKYIFILFLILNIKGVANLFPFLILLFFYKKEVLK
ncbi:hypothetical protein MJ046_10035 [Acinetobacter bereziniae]|uniref:hypothetical protein n=1 Tax=Acinetobacter bereziniae TaxID=106648 RepID=UPI00224DBB6A|nr:hypothetical protein [Acinetobacter bereziniae]MDA3440682.1 hypothetical protein [Acinetobacter bereziniae]